MENPPITIVLDGQIHSSLEWKAAHAQAESWIEKGHQLFWEMDLGLFDRLPHPLSNETQCRTLGLALDHFYHTIWKKFEKESLGVSLYKGTINVNQTIAWDEKLQVQLEQKPATPFARELFFRNVALEYLQLLAEYLSADVPSYLFLDMTTADVTTICAWYSALERYPRLQLAVKGKETFPHLGTGWGHPHPVVASRIAICLPPADCESEKAFLDIAKAIHWLNSQKIPFRIIQEEFLVVKWEQLDYLVISPLGITDQSKRKLLGFRAAGGEVVFLEGPLPKGQWTNWTEWTSWTEWTELPSSYSILSHLSI